MATVNSEISVYHIKIDKYSDMRFNLLFEYPHKVLTSAGVLIKNASIKYLLHNKPPITSYGFIHCCSLWYDKRQSWSVHVFKSIDFIWVTYWYQSWQQCCLVPQDQNMRSEDPLQNSKFPSIKSLPLNPFSQFSPWNEYDGQK